MTGLSSPITHLRREKLLPTTPLECFAISAAGLNGLPARLLRACFGESHISANGTHFKSITQILLNESTEFIKILLNYDY